MTRRSFASPFLPRAFALGLMALAACSGSPDRYVVPPTPDEGSRIAIAYGTVAVREISLPSYAASEEIHVRMPDGALRSSADVLWADDPTRAMTGEVAGMLSRITGAQVAAEPWPFFDRARATVEIRVTDMFAEDGGPFRLSGQYFVVPESGGRGRAARFEIVTPIAPDGGPTAIAAARGVAVRDLARTIARDGLR